MPSKLQKAIAAVKDQTSISLAKVGGSSASNLEVAILKATKHEEVPVDERHVTEVLQYVSSNRAYAGSCARAIGRRIGRTRNWVVAVKSLILVLRIFQDGDPHFPKEVLHAMKRGYKILNLSGFRDDSTSSCPWDFTAFVRTFALYLDERLDCFLTGKLQRRTSHHQFGKTRGFPRKNVPIVRDMKPSVLLDRISHWQRLLDRAIATRPTGAAKTNRLVQTCLHTIVQETFELYRDISDGLALLLDSFFHLQYNNCVSAFQTCVKATKQFEELCSFYDVCKSIGVGRTSEYPSVQKISEELVNTLQEFLKDQSSFPGTNGRTPGISTSLPPLSPKDSESGSVRPSDRSLSEFGGSHCTSLEDLIGVDPRFSPDRYSDPGRENPPHSEEFFSGNDCFSVRSDPTSHGEISSVLDLLSLDGPSPPPEPQITGQGTGIESVDKAGWELVLFETSNQTSSQPNNPTLTSPIPAENSYFNPFLADTIADLNGVSGTHSSGFEANFTEGDLGFGLQTSTTTAATSTSTISPTFQAEFCNSSMNGFDNYSSGFPTNLGFGHVSSFPTVFKDDFADEFGCEKRSFATDLGFGMGSSTTKLTISPTFQTEPGNTSMTSLDRFSGSFPTNLGLGRVSSLPTVFKDDFGADFGSTKNSFVSDLAVGTGSTTTKLTISPTFRAEHGNTSMTGLDHFPTNLGFGRVSSLPTTFKDDFGADFGSEKSSFIADSGVGIASSTTALTTSPTVQPQLGFSGSFPPNLGFGRVSSLPTTFKDDFGDDFDSGKSGFIADFGLASGSSTTTLTTSPAFQAEFTNTSMNGSDNFSGSSPPKLGFGRVSSLPTTFKDDFGDDFDRGKSSFVADFGPATGSSTTTLTTSPTFQAEFANTHMNGSDRFTDSVPTNFGFKVDFGDDFSCEKSSFITPKPTFQAEVLTNGIGNSISHQSLQIDLFANFGNPSAPKPDHSSSMGDSFGPTLDGISNDMKALVIFSQASNDDFSSRPKLQAAPTFRANSIDMDHQDRQFSLDFENDPFRSSGPKLQSAPTFRATSVDMDHQNRQFSLCFENDPFGSFAAAPALEQQQQLWLQNQNKIMARHIS